MFLDEFAIKGARGHAGPLVRHALPRGLGVVPVADASVRVQLVDLLFHTLFPHPRLADATQAWAALDADEARFALTVTGRDGARWRLIRELREGQVSAYRRDEAGRFVIAARTAPEVQQVTATLGLPPPRIYEQLYVLGHAERPSAPVPAPSRAGGAWARPEPLRLEPPPAAAPRPPSLAPDERAAERARLQVLEGQLSELETLEAERTRLSEERARLAPGVERRRAAQAELARLDEAEAASDLPTGLPDDIVERLREFEREDERQDAERKRLAAERLEADRVLGEHFVAPLAQDRYFVAGLVWAAAWVVAGLVAEMPPLVLLNLLGALVALGAAIRFLGEREEHERREARLVGLEAAETRQRAEFEARTGVVRGLLRGARLGPAELADQLEQAQARAPRRAELEAELRALEATSDRDPQAELDALDAALETVEARRMLLGTQLPDGVDLETIRARRARLDTPPPIAALAPSSDGGPAMGPAQAAGPSPRVSSGLLSFDDLDAELAPDERWGAILNSGAELLGLPPGTLGPAIAQRLGQFVTALNDGALTGARLDGATLELLGPGGVVAPASLSGPLQDAVDLALRLTLVEAGVLRRPSPILIDDPLVGAPPARRALFAQMLAYLGARTQVVVLSPLADLGPLAPAL